MTLAHSQSIYQNINIILSIIFHRRAL